MRLERLTYQGKTLAYYELTDGPNEIECTFLASLSSLVKCLRVRPQANQCNGVTLSADPSGATFTDTLYWVNPNTFPYLQVSLMFTIKAEAYMLHSSVGS